MVKLGCFLLMIITLCLNKVPSCQATSKPYCEPTEVCTVKEYYLHACRCRGNSTCGAKSDSTLDYGGVQYDFCQPMNFRQCAENEVAWAHKGITRQIVYCICPAHLKVMEDTVMRLNSNIRKFRCVAPKTCDVNETCKVRNKVFTGEKIVTSLKGLCECPDEFDCEETGEILKPKPYLKWEQEIWRCRSSAD